MPPPREVSLVPTSCLGVPSFSGSVLAHARTPLVADRDTDCLDLPSPENTLRNGVLFGLSRSRTPCLVAPTGDISVVSYRRCPESPTHPRPLQRHRWSWVRLSTERTLWSLNSDRPSLHPKSSQGDCRVPPSLTVPRFVFGPRGARWCNRSDTLFRSSHVRPSFPGSPGRVKDPCLVTRSHPLRVGETLFGPLSGTPETALMS